MTFAAGLTPPSMYESGGTLYLVYRTADGHLHEIATPPTRATWAHIDLTGTLVDDPDALFYENYKCGGVGNYNNYCNAEIDKVVKSGADAQTFATKICAFINKG